MSDVVVSMAEAKRCPDQDLVARLESVLELAKSGELVSFHGAGILAGGDVVSTTGPFMNMSSEIGALELIKARMLDRVLSDE